MRRATLSDLVNGHASLSPEMALRVEKAFGVPGLGMTMIDAILDRDLPVVQNLVLLYTVVFVVINLITDLSYAWLDPRIRVED